MSDWISFLIFFILVILEKNKNKKLQLLSYKHCCIQRLKYFMRL